MNQLQSLHTLQVLILIAYTTLFAYTRLKLGCFNHLMPSDGQKKPNLSANQRYCILSPFVKL